MNARGLRKKVHLTSVRHSHTRIDTFWRLFARLLLICVSLKNDCFVCSLFTYDINFCRILCCDLAGFCFAGNVNYYDFGDNGDFGREEISVIPSNTKVQFENSLDYYKRILEDTSLFL